jgi:ketosteroid isomerase-like protein
MGVEREDLREINELFYKALGDLDLEAMDRLWLHEPWVRCIHPSSEALVGWESVRRSWQQIFENTRWIRVVPTAVDLQLYGDVGIVACAENITASNDGDVGVAVAQATNLYLATPKGWRMMVHHASPAPVHVTQPFSGRVQ